MTTTVPARRSPGQRAGLSRQAVLGAALELVDRDGLKALSMRSLGRELDVEAMTLYHYVPGKDALLDGVVEQVVAAVAPPRPGGSWQAALRDLAQALLDALRAHPHVLPLVAARPAMTALNLRLLESVLTSLYRAGFPERRALDVLHAVTCFVIGHATTTPEPSAGAVAAAGRTDPSAGSSAPPVSDLDADRFPLLTEAMHHGPHRDGGRRFDFALEAMLCGFDSVRTRAP